MSKMVVRAQKLCKAYTLYPSPWHRMREILGRPRPKGVEFPSHVAIDNIDLEIHSGEKVAFIGRNGAGKSTLLKLVTGVIEPTSGTLDIVGETHALLQMGSGFHQEFTGRQNVNGYLANLGVAGSEAESLVRDIIEFSELEEYIDQPLKTYSTGMAMRLIFAASTSVAPKMFVIDEVLGVGDAYFQQKSFARLQELVEKNATTLLLVSHDVYSAAKIASRMIWIDRGRIKYDGDSKTALNLYESSIKEQEEQRLRKKAIMPSAGGARSMGRDWVSALVEIRPSKGLPLAAPVTIVSAELLDGQEVLATLGAENSEKRAILEIVEEGASWGPRREGARGYEIQNFGSAFHKGILRVSAANLETLRRATLALGLRAAQVQALDVVLIGEKGHQYLAGQAEAGPAGLTLKVPLDPTGLPEVDLDIAPDNKRHGSGAIRFSYVELIDGTNKSTRLFRQGEPFVIEMGYDLLDPSCAGNLELNIAISRDGVIDVTRAFYPTLSLPPDRKRGKVQMIADELALANGTFVMSILIAKRGYYASNPVIPFSLNPDVYDVVARAVEFQVEERHLAYRGTVAECKSRWRVEAISEDE